MIVEITENDKDKIKANKSNEIIVKFKSSTGKYSRIFYGSRSSNVQALFEAYKEFLLDEAEQTEKVADKL